MKKRSSSMGGYQMLCYLCAKFNGYKWVKENPQKVKLIQQKADDKRSTSVKRKTRKNNKDTTKKALKKWFSNNLEKKRAHSRLLYAVRTGAIVRQPCEVCGAVKVEGHHEDYSKPLDVRWLCRVHHKHHHKIRKRLIDGTGNIHDTV